MNNTLKERISSTFLASDLPPTSNRVYVSDYLMCHKHTNENTDVLFETACYSLSNSVACLLSFHHSSCHRLTSMCMFLTHTRLTVKHVMLLYVCAHVCLVAREAAMWELEERHLQEKHQQLKQIMDQLRKLIWEINSMLAVRS